MNIAAFRAFSVGWLSCAGVVVACSSGGGDHPPSNVSFDTGLHYDSAVVDAVTDSHRADAADADAKTDVGDATLDSTTDSSADTKDATVVDTLPETPPDAGPPACDPTKDWTTVADDPLSSLSTTGADDVLGGVTPDELTIVWVTQSDPDLFVKVADRTDTASAFGTPQIVAGTYGFTRVAVSGDGLTLIATDSTRKTLVKLTRAARGDAFGSPDTTGFDALNALAFDGPTHLGDPTLSADGAHLLVSAQGLSLSTQIYESTFGGGAWGTPVKQVVSWTGLDRPSAYSFDARTLFVTDPSLTGYEAFRPAIGWPWDTTVSIGAHAYAAPSAACTKLYFSRPVNPDGTDLDLFVTR